MSKTLIRLFILVALLLIAVSGCGKKDITPPLAPNNISNQPEQIDYLSLAKESVENYKNYKYSESELENLKRSQKNVIFYYASNGLRYTFPEKPDQPIFRSWFKDYDVTKIPEYDLDTLYKTELGGNVTLRPGTLVKTETVFETYISSGNGVLKKIPQEIIDQVYGSNWQDNVIEIPNFYFAQYDTSGKITTLADFPNIPKSLTIEKDKGIK